MVDYAERGSVCGSRRVGANAQHENCQLLATFCAPCSLRLFFGSGSREGEPKGPTVQGCYNAVPASAFWTNAYVGSLNTFLTLAVCVARTYRVFISSMAEATHLSRTLVGTT